MRSPVLAQFVLPRMLSCKWLIDDDQDDDTAEFKNIPTDGPHDEKVSRSRCV